MPIIEHADVRRMLLRQKAIVEGRARADPGRPRASPTSPTHAADAEAARRARSCCSICSRRSPRAFPAEKGFESNALAVQIHGGYGYSSEYLPEAWLRDQKLNSIHEGTTGIQGMDLLGRKVVAGGGAALRALRDEVARGGAARARRPASTATSDRGDARARWAASAALTLRARRSAASAATSTE